ncbi:MAG: hotdog fold thioesterase [Desulfobacteraceae bacterium]|nr:MAG: hotdog fold thioesterase [Desulfobacteraceae bacterium]
MDPAVRTGIFAAVENEPFARALKMKLIALELGHSVVEMTYDPALMNNIYARAHGGALFALIDEAFETASQTHGTIAVALNVNVTYIRPPQAGERLRAQADESARTRKTATYRISVSDPAGDLIATCQALAYCTGKPVPFKAA